MVKNLPAMWQTRVLSLSWEDPLEKGKAPTPVFWPGELQGFAKSWTFENLKVSNKIVECSPPLPEFTHGNNYLEQSSYCYINMFSHFSCSYLTGREGNDKPLQYSCWKIPWTEELGRLQSMWSQRVEHDPAISLSLFTFMHWRRKWQPTPVFLPGESQGWRSLVGCRLWHRTELDTIKAT